jgi:hypothetical protein
LTADIEEVRAPRGTVWWARVRWHDRESGRRESIKTLAFHARGRRDLDRRDAERVADGHRRDADTGRVRDLHRRPLD